MMKNQVKFENFDEMGDGGVKNLAKMMTSFMDGPYLDLDIKINSNAAMDPIFSHNFTRCFLEYQIIYDRDQIINCKM